MLLFRLKKQTSKNVADTTFKVKNGLSNQIISELFNLRNIEYNLRSQTFHLEQYTTNYGLRSLRCFVPKIWNMISADIRNVNNLSDFPLKIKSWIPDACPCNLYRAYIFQVGYMN